MGKVIGPQLPQNLKNPSSPKPGLSGPSPKLIQEPSVSKPKPSPVLQIKPKMISEPTGKPVTKPVIKPMKSVQLLVPYDGGSSSEEEVAVKTLKSSSPNPSGPSPKSLPALSSPFLPRSVAVNFK